MIPGDKNALMLSNQNLLKWTEVLKRLLIPSAPLLQMGKRWSVMVKVTQEIRVLRRDKSIRVWNDDALICIRGLPWFWFYEYANYVWSWGCHKQEHITHPLNTNSFPLAVWFLEHLLQAWCLSFIHIGKAKCSWNNNVLRALLAIHSCCRPGEYINT